MSTHAAGPFFDAPPMKYYGGSLLGYLSAFGLKGPVALILASPNVDASVFLNDGQYACGKTGFMPLHAAVANGRDVMFDYLIGRSVKLDDACRMALYDTDDKGDGKGVKGYITLKAAKAATYSVRTAITSDPSLSGLTPLQLAAQLGDHRMCKHILCARLIFNWRWGPLTSYKMELTEIDSSSEGGNDIMEVVASLDATPMTRELLLDTFMQGFLHELFLSKWRRFAGSIYYLLRTIDFAYLLVVLYQGFVLKQNPYANVTPATYASLALASVLAFVEFSACFLWWRNESQYDMRSLRSTWRKLRALWRWMSGFKTEMRVTSYIASITGCVIFLRIVPNLNPKTGLPTELELIFLFYAYACYGHFRSLMQSLFVSPSFPSLGVHLITIEKMFANDVMTFLIFLFLYMFNYFTSMFITFPKSGTVSGAEFDLSKGLEEASGTSTGSWDPLADASEIDNVIPDAVNPLAPFDDVVQAFSAIYNMAIFGVRFATNLDLPTLQAFNTMQWLNFIVFFFHHTMFAIMCLTLLVRLLMAMMTNTFQSVKKSALLEWRLMIARAVLRHELLYSWSPQEYRLAGTRGADGKYYHSFLHVRPDPDGQVHVPLQLAQQRSASLFADDDNTPLEPSDEADESQKARFFADENTEVSSTFSKAVEVTAAPLLHRERLPRTNSQAEPPLVLDDEDLRRADGTAAVVRRTDNDNKQ